MTCEAQSRPVRGGSEAEGLDGTSGIGSVHVGELLHKGIEPCGVEWLGVDLRIYTCGRPRYHDARPHAISPFPSDSAPECALCGDALDRPWLRVRVLLPVGDFIHVECLPDVGGAVADHSESGSAVPHFGDPERAPLDDDGCEHSERRCEDCRRDDAAFERGDRDREDRMVGL